MRVLLAALLCVASLSAALADDVSPAAKRPRLVMTWVPPYAIDASLTQLKRRYGVVGPGTALTHLGLQFWTPKADGTLARDSTYGTITDAIIHDIAAWAHRHGIKVMLCVYNFVGSWDWDLAKSAFGAQRKTFVAALLQEVQALDLDGIDIDLEGDEDRYPHVNGDKAAYVAFIKALRKRLHVIGKQLTVDSFPHIWDAPNTRWWSELFPLVDGMTSMGYANTGRNAPGWQAYAAQRTAAGRHVRKLMIGLPSWRDRWQGDSALSQVQWFLGERNVGVSMWDAQFQAKAWQTKSIWQALHQINGR